MIETYQYALATFVVFQILLFSFERLDDFWISVDQVFNVFLGSGYADETLSAYAHRKQGWRRATINAIFFWQEDHCHDSYYSERERRHLPPEYRQ